MSHPAGTVLAMTLLTDLDRQVLAIEARWWKYAGAKEQAVHALGLDVTSYYAHLGRLLDEPAALERDPMTVLRLRRLREQRAGRRARLRAG